MAKRRSRPGTRDMEAQRRWLDGRIKSMQRELAEAITRLEGMGEEPPPPPPEIKITRPEGYVTPIMQLQEQIDHVHYDLVAIRAKLDIPNPGCAPAEEHAEA
jgi:hypothetical protein